MAFELVSRLKFLSWKHQRLVQLLAFARNLSHISKGAVASGKFPRVCFAQISNEAAIYANRVSFQRTVSGLDSVVMLPFRAALRN